jgi:hypothetical protein
VAIKVYHGKCPRCCPDGGACFSPTYLEDGLAKQCNNCGHIINLRKRPRATGKPNATQQRVINRITSLFGGIPEITPVSPTSRRVWISLKNYDRPMLVGDSLFGTIGPNGAFKITLQRLFGDKVLTDDIGLDVYLAWRRS